MIKIRIRSSCQQVELKVLKGWIMQTNQSLKNIKNGAMWNFFKFKVVDALNKYNDFFKNAFVKIQYYFVVIYACKDYRCTYQH